MSLKDTARLTQQLVRKPSITPDDAGCQTLLAERLEPQGFKCRHLRFEDVDNLWATRCAGSLSFKPPVFVFAGHTDVVPTGPEEDWLHHPFSGMYEDGFLYGRGTADMKGSIAAFITACERFIADCPNHHGTIGLLITSDEEGPAQYGTRAVMQALSENSQSIDYCIVGEPSSHNRLGDRIKIGRRGSLNGHLTVYGKQGHIAYPDRTDNPLHRILPAIDQLRCMVWDKGNENFDPTQFQISNFQGGTGATNVTPGKVEIIFNFRFSPEVQAQQLIQQVETVLVDHGLDFSIDWDLSGLPFETKKGRFTELVSKAVEQVTGYQPELSTSGGTSDGRFIAQYHTELIELGPINKTIHQINECVSVSDLDALSLCYQQVLKELLT